MKEALGEYFKNKAHPRGTVFEIERLSTSEAEKKKQQERLY